MSQATTMPTAPRPESGVYRAQRMLEPESIAIIGASAGDGLGATVLANLLAHGYAGDVHLVNPRYDRLGDRPCYHSIEDVPVSVDLAVLIVPADAVPEAIRGCVRAGVGAAVVMAAGFAEDARGRGRERQAEIDEAVKDSDLVICGPNSEGFFNLRSGVAVSFGGGVALDQLRDAAAWADPDTDDAGLHRAVAGNVAIIAQSGGLGFSVFSRGVAEGMGFSDVISVGNESDLDVLDCAEYLITRPEVRVIGMYVEGFRHPERLAPVARAAAEAGKVLVIGKAGRSAVGGHAAMSHTGHLAGEARVYDAAFRRLGIVQVFDQEELLDVCWACSAGRLPGGNAAAVVSWSGGSAVWTADACEREGFELPELDAQRQAELAEFLPPFAGLRNPVDITGAARVGTGQVLRKICDAPYLDALILITTLHGTRIMERDYDDLERLVSETVKPIFVYTYTEPVPQNRRMFRDLGLPLYPSSARCVRAMRAARWVAEHRAAAQAEPDAAGGADGAGEAVEWPAAVNGVLTERQSTELLRAAGFQAARQVLATTADEAVAAAADIGLPVALKLQAPSLPHKASAGAVLLDVGDLDAVRAGFTHLMVEVAPSATDREGVLVQQMIPAGGLEMLVGVDNTAGVGPMIMLGFGGSQVERLRDSVMEAAPVNRAEGLRMVESLRLGPLFTAGLHGFPHPDTDALTDFLVRLSRFAVQHADRIRELDVNPLVVGENGVIIVDSLIITTPAQAG